MALREVASRCFGAKPVLAPYVALFGAPGVGKGTAAKYIEKKYDV